MLRAILLVSPVVLVVAVSCSSSDSADFKDTTPPGNDAGTSSTTGGASSTAGSSATAGSNAAGGSSATAGNGNTGGNGNTAGNGNTGGNGNTSGNGNTAGNGNSAGSGGTTGTAGSGNAGTTNGNAGAPGAGGAPSGAAGANAGGADGGALCPDVLGAYTIKGAEGLCNGLNKDATQSITNSAVATCFVDFASAVQEGGQGVNGGAKIDENGDFTGSVLFLNKTERNPCNGVWDAGNQRMTIKCGGQGDQCTVVLERN